jgi:hypothetical protein
LGEEGDHREAEETADEVSAEQAGGIGEPGAARLTRSAARNS